MRDITVSQLNGYIKAVFEAEEMLHNITVIGEISGAKQSGNAVYFTLKDDQAAISCTVFGGVLGGAIADGVKVCARGTVSYWNKAGKISFIVNKVEKFGAGDLMLLFKELQEKLRAEGLFDQSHKKQIPQIVRRIGVVTSKTGAVIHDIETVVHRRNQSIDIVLFPVPVQGTGAETEIATAINYFSCQKKDRETNKQPPRECAGNPVDVIIVARGGGSAEDLSPFNTEIVARAVFASSVPVVSAVGHENDFTLIDFVADLRAGTPSIAAELCAREELLDRDRAIAYWHHIKIIARAFCDRKSTEIRTIARDLKNTATARFNEIENTFALMTARIDERNPIAVLKRGFVKPNKNLNTLKKGDLFEILYYNKNAVKKGQAEWKS